MSVNPNMIATKSFTVKEFYGENFEIPEGFQFKAFRILKVGDMFVTETGQTLTAHEYTRTDRPYIVIAHKPAQVKARRFIFEECVLKIGEAHGNCSWSTDANAWIRFVGEEKKS